MPNPNLFKTHDPIQFKSGDTWEILFSCQQADDAAMDLTNAAIEWKLADEAGKRVLTKTVGNCVTILTPATAGQCLVKIEPTETKDIAAGYYRDELRVTTRDGIVSTQVSGRIQALAAL